MSVIRFFYYPYPSPRVDALPWIFHLFGFFVVLFLAVHFSNSSWLSLGTQTFLFDYLNKIVAPLGIQWLFPAQTLMLIASQSGVEITSFNLLISQI